MKKVVFSLLLVSIMILSSASIAFADDGEIYVDEIQKEDHKIRNKWDFVGTFTSSRGWDGAPSGSTWGYEIHIKEALEPSYSKGVILLELGDNSITAHVEDFKNNYAYWYGNSGHPEITNIGAVGWAEYNGEVFNFMFLYNANAIWMALSGESYSSAWGGGTVWGSDLRIYEVHSTVVPSQFAIEPKSIR